MRTIFQPLLSTGSSLTWNWSYTNKSLGNSGWETIVQGRDAFRGGWQEVRGVFPWVEPVSCAMQQIVGEWNINSSPKNENKILP